MRADKKAAIARGAFVVERCTPVAAHNKKVLVAPVAIAVKRLALHKSGHRMKDIA